MLFLFQQLCGINAIQNYSTKIFISFGQAEFSARVCTLAIKLFSIFGTTFAFFFVDKFGRKPLLIFGNIGMMICLFLMGLFSDLDEIGLIFPMFLIVTYLLSFEISAGPITWVYCGEILSAKMMSVSVCIKWIFMILVVFTFPLIVNMYGINSIFYIYSFVCGSAIFYV